MNSSRLANIAAMFMNALPSIRVVALFAAYGALCWTMVAAGDEVTRTPARLQWTGGDDLPGWLVPRYPEIRSENGLLVLQRPDESGKRAHNASIGVPIKSGDAAVSCRFTLQDADSFSLRFEAGFNKHLCRLVITRSEIRLEAVDADRPSDSRSRLLDSQPLSATTDRPFDVTLAIDGDTATATVDDITLTGTSDTFRSAKTSVVWAVRGGPVSFDRITVRLDGDVLTEPTFSRRMGTSIIDAASDAVADADGSMHSQDETESRRLYSDVIKPLLASSCLDCHSHATGEASGGLMLDSYGSIRSGGESGPAVVPHDLDESMLLAAIRYDGSFYDMPPDGRLPQDQIDAVERWIETGAVGDAEWSPSETEVDTASTETVDATEAEPLWSMQPIADPPVPAVRDASWPRSDVDRFILSGLEGVDLAPAPDADPQVLLRRIAFVLTGLPPSPEEIGSFAIEFADDPNAAVQRAVDSRLGTQAFGERWGRHWLDLARYADVHGGTRPEPMTESWRYRNYVIEAFASDKPFDEFVREQLAGDLLPPDGPLDRAENLVATGFLAIGHYDRNERDENQARMDTIDEQLDTIGKSLLGMTLGCARCHDHKFDPVPARDYYALAGILGSTDSRTNPLGRGPREIYTTLPVDLPESAPYWARADQTIHRRKRNGKQPKEDQPPRTLAVRDAATPADEPIHLRGDAERTGAIVPRGFLTAVRLPAVPMPQDQSGRLELADWILDARNPLTARVAVNRVWRHAFGEGIVRTVDNFGVMGEQPSHPELLDHLATKLRTPVREGGFGWSIAKLVRELVLSRTFAQSSISAIRSDTDAAVAHHPNEIDPENRLLWRANRRRLDAESLHDALYAVSGRLNTESADFTVPHGFRVANDANTSEVPIPPETLARRAVYWPVFRKDVPVDMDLLATFDFANPMSTDGRRDSSTVPAQALLLMNSAIVIDAARKLSTDLNRAREDGTNEAILVRELYLRTLCREPTPLEADDALGFLDAFSDAVEEADAAKKPRAVAWNRLCHTLLLSNAFLVLD